MRHEAALFVCGNFRSSGKWLDYFLRNRCDTLSRHLLLIVPEFTATLPSSWVLVSPLLWCYCLGSEIRISATATLSLTFPTLIKPEVINKLYLISFDLRTKNSRERHKICFPFKKKYLEPKQAWKLLLCCKSVHVWFPPVPSPCAM